ncbi:hypothetical protein ACLOJK_010400 [Asimina triloba]
MCQRRFPSRSQRGQRVKRHRCLKCEVLSGDWAEWKAVLRGHGYVSARESGSEDGAVLCLLGARAESAGAASQRGKGTICR